MHSTSWITSANLIEAPLDSGEARFDHRFELKVGEYIRPVVLDAFTDKLSNVRWVYPLRDPFADDRQLLR